MTQRPISWYVPGKKILVSDKMQNNYHYSLSAPYGDVQSAEFKPELTPPQMLAMGVFEGKYLNDCIHEFPKEWYEEAFLKNKLSKDGNSDPELNYFKIKSRQPLQLWRENHWIYGPDIRGWFQWYCRYYLGRRLPEVDKIQKARWRAFKRHKGQILAHCRPGDMKCRPRQRQALLQWAYDPTF